MLGLKFAVGAEEPTSSIGSAKGSKSAFFELESTDSASEPASQAVAWSATTDPQVSFEGSDLAFARTSWAVSSLTRTASVACCLEKESFAAAVTIVHQQVV